MSIAIPGEGAAPARGPLDPRGRIHLPIGIANTVDTLKTFVEAEGCFSPGVVTYGISFWVYDTQTRKLAAPTMEGVACEHGLAPGGALIPWSAWDAHGVRVRTEVCQVRRPSPAGEVQVVGARVRLANAGPKPAKLQLYAALRPLGPAGGPVRRLSVGADGQALLVEGHPALVAEMKPVGAGVLPVDTVGQSALAGELPDAKDAESPAGDCSGALRFEVSIPAGQAVTLGFICPVLPGRRAVGHRWDGKNPWAQLDDAVPNPPEGGELQPDPGVAYYCGIKGDTLFREAQEYWRDLAGRVRIELPDSRWEEAFAAITGHLALCLNEDAPDVSVVNYNVFNRDGMYSANVFQKAGHPELAAAAIDYFLSHPFNGRIHPEADNPGQILWILGEQWLFTRDRAWLERVYPGVRKLAALVRYYRTAPGPHWVDVGSLEFGEALAPERRQELKPGACDGHHPEYTEAYDVAGLRQAAMLAEALGHAEEAADWRKLADTLFGSYDREFGGRLAREYGSYAVLWPCRLYPFEQGKAWGQFRGVGAQKPAGWRYFPLATAHQGLLAGNREAGCATLAGHLEHEQMRGWYAFDEGGRSGAGGWRHARTSWNPDVAMPHGWAIAELQLLLRDSLLFEEGGRLVLLPGVPPEWFTHPRGMRVRDLPTHFGPCSLSYTPTATGALLRLEGKASPPEGFLLRLPADLNARATCDGKPVAALTNGDLPLPASAREVRLEIPSMKLRNVTLEMSLKPFREMEDEAIRGVARHLFRQWLPLLGNAEGVSVLLWTADGSEILDYQGNPDTEIEWARYIGGANPRQKLNGDPDGKALHSRSYLYMENPPVITYRGLARIVALLKDVGREVTGLPVRVGATFDPGPEFAKSPFKYERHNEICLAGTMGRSSFVCCYGVLKGDTERYAGFPNGIPDGTPFGTFFGRQCQHFLADLGFDYVWFSNGFGFGRETWATTGALFDGKESHPDQAASVREKVLQFWRLFRQECPDYPIETRGTNLTTGIDLASDGVPLAEIYAGGFNLAPPPNSPWAALNGDFGFELVGYMSHIAEVPGDGYPFRFYTHDPWWLNSPWLDRYGREPHDIYLPLSVCRLDAQGKAHTPTAFEFLTADDSYGRMPDQVPNEVIPHLLQARAHAPDQPGPVVWVYPFAEYHELTFGKEPRLPEVFFGDWFIRAAVNEGFPLNTVISSANLPAALEANPAAFRESVLVSRVPDRGTPLAGALLRWVQSGGRALLYGPLEHADPALLQALNLRLAEPLSGEMDVVCRGEAFAEEAAGPTMGPAQAPPAYTARVQHRELFCAGGIRAVVADEREGNTEVLATVSKAGEERAAALCRRLPEWNGGALAWVRGTNSASYKGGHLLTPDSAKDWFQGGLLMRAALTRFGYEFGVRKRRPEQRTPLTCVARRDNGFFLSGYTPNTTVSLRLRFPQGAPILVGYETELAEGRATYTMPRAWHRECRVFVDGQREGEISCVEQHSGEIGIRRRLLVTGLQGATLRFYPERGSEGQVQFLRDPVYPYFVGDFLSPRLRDDREGHSLDVENVTGPVLISW